MNKMLEAVKSNKKCGKNKNVAVIVLATNEVIPQASNTQNIKNISKFHQAMKFVISLAQFFGIMPVYGIREPSIDDIRFKWVSWKTFHSFFAIFTLLFSAVLFLYQWIMDDMSFGQIVGVVYYGLQSIGCIFFIKLAKKWMYFNKEWLKMEIEMDRYSYQPNDKLRFTVTTLVIMILALIEHLFSVSKYIITSQGCPNVDKEPLRKYFGLCCAYLFTITDYALWKAIFIEIPIIISTFHWNFMDVFIILCSAAMAERFKQINKQITVSQVQNYQFWKAIREDYNRLWNLTKTLDEIISNMISISFASNLFFICWQMFNSLKPKGDNFNSVYFMYSFGFLLGRTATVSVYCCWINDESKELLTSLFNIPQDNYSPEVERLINQIICAPAALTGSNFFSVTRSLCLQVASAIVTFEIVLVQMGPTFFQTDSAKPLFCL